SDSDPHATTEPEPEPVPAAPTIGTSSGDPDLPASPSTAGHIAAGTLSYTALSELERCGYRYYLERVLGLPEDRSAGRAGAPRGGLGARARGVLVHRLLESLDFAHPIAPTSPEVAAAARALGVTVAPGEREELAALVGAAATSGLARRVAAAEQVHREYPFAFTLTSPERLPPRVSDSPEQLTISVLDSPEQLTIGVLDSPQRLAAGVLDQAEQLAPGALDPSEQLATGVLDLLAREPSGGWLVVDYKSDRVGESDDLEELVRREYGIQRLLYALAALHAGAPEVEVVHWFVERPREWVGERFQAGEREQLEERLRGRVERARARGFAVSASPRRDLCLTCPGRARLCSWDEADTLRERSVGIGGPPTSGER
ncbi:MAG TPA: PD-(D/E)XK nuclease family protein, partial [Solirubrobacteraceae bacterium]|nr:PD-(D/E)XK nuclease family protein [Solirubrobacteraceae bacterium]